MLTPTGTVSFSELLEALKGQAEKTGGVKVAPKQLTNADAVDMENQQRLLEMTQVLSLLALLVQKVRMLTVACFTGTKSTHADVLLLLQALQEADALVTKQREQAKKREQIVKAESKALALRAKFKQAMLTYADVC
jgi:hypothetical protein